MKTLKNIVMMAFVAIAMIMISSCSSDHEEEMPNDLLLGILPPEATIELYDVQLECLIQGDDMYEEWMRVMDMKGFTKDENSDKYVYTGHMNGEKVREKADDVYNTLTEELRILGRYKERIIIAGDEISVKQRIFSIK